MLSRDGSVRKLRSSSALHSSAAWVRRFGSSSCQFGDVCRRPRCQERSAKKGIMSCRGPCENVARHARLTALRPQGHTAPSNMKQQMIQMPQLRSIAFPELTHSQRSNDSSGAQASSRDSRCSESEPVKLQVQLLALQKYPQFVSQGSSCVGEAMRLHIPTQGISLWAHGTFPCHSWRPPRGSICSCRQLLSLALACLGQYCIIVCIWAC